MTTISQPRQLVPTGSVRQGELARTTVGRVRAAITRFTAHAPHRTSAAAPARDITLRARRASAGPSLTESQRFRLPR
jgi:hypothetical protein